MKIPRPRIEKLPRPSRSIKLLIPVLSVVMALLVGTILLLSTGVNPLDAYLALLLGAFGSKSGVTETLVKMIPLLLAGLGVAFAFKCNVLNIGAEGQIMMGGFAAALVALTFKNAPAIVLLPSVIVAGFLAGAAWGSIAGILKAKLQVNEVITTLMMTYIAILWVNYLVFEGPMTDPKLGFPWSEKLPSAAWLPRLLDTRLHAGIFLALLATVLVYVILQKTTVGYKIRALGANPKAARYAGITVFKYVMLAMIISGGLAGLAGVGEVCGIQYRLKPGISAGYGFIAIAVALLGRLNPWGVTLAAFFVGGLFVGGNAMQRAVGVPTALMEVIIMLILIFVLAGEFFTCYKLTFNWRQE